jgi:hypothetical protein
LRRARWLLLLGLFATPALAADPPPDAGGAQAGQSLSAEDQEIVDNLDLLQNLEAAKELDTMLQLAQAEQTDGGKDDSSQ